MNGSAPATALPVEPPQPNGTAVAIADPSVESNGARAQRLMRQVLDVLARGSFSVRDIAEDLHLDAADCSLVVRKLVDSGRVRRLPDQRYALVSAQDEED